MFCVLLYFVPVFSQTVIPTAPRKTINVGVAIVEHVQQENIGWSVCGGALSLALDYLHMQNYLLDVDFNFFYNYTECDADKAVAIGVDFVKNKNVDVILGPPCPGSAYMMGTLATAFKTYMISWGYVSDIEFGNMDKFTYLTTLMPNSVTLAYAAIKVLERFEWDRFAFLYTDDDVNYCGSIFQAIQELQSVLLLNSTYTSSMVYYSVLPRGNSNAYSDILTRTKARARIVMVCFNSPIESRDFMSRASDNGMVSDEYVYLMLSMMSTGFGQNGNGTVKLASGLTPFWVDVINGNKDQKDASARDGAKRTILDLNSRIEDMAWLAKFNDEVLRRVRDPPVSCTTPECFSNGVKQPGGFARQLHDAFYLYGISLTKAMERDPIAGYRNPAFLQEGVQVKKLNGLSGEISMNSNTTRDPYYAIYYLDDKFAENMFLNVTVLNNEAEAYDLLDNEGNTIWSTRGGKRPLARPVCGFTGVECPLTFMQQYFIYVVVGISVAVVILSIMLLVIGFTVRTKRQFLKRQREECQIAISRLQKPAKFTRNSKRSLTSNPSTITTNTDRSYANANYYEVYVYDKEQVMVSEHESSLLSQSDYDDFVKVRKLDHPNLNQFIGISVDGPDFKVVWKYCSRSSLYDIIANKDISTMDAFFIYCVIKDIAEGLTFLHRSFIHFHGHLHSGCCLVNDGWQVKITDHGMRNLKHAKKAKDKVQLWVAPEHLRQPGSSSSSGDIYSFAIIASEVVNRKSPFNYKERREGLDELIYLIKKGGIRPVRPEFDATDVDVSSALLSLIRDCWSEEPGERPTAEAICSTMTSIMPKENGNLIDHVFAKMEEYTGTLEMEVEDRTKELAAEKKKADTLLSRMLPKQVAEKLKLGQVVEPEGFDSVSVLFMDIVKFTQLAAKCSPLQVVSLLNELFSSFDGIIERHDVYKVESIGDGYLCVSGLPTRNGFRHIREIVEMALVLMDYVKDFRIPHLPRERVELRIGVNSGPCVAGVVGLAMPRYCLFGDTVNTASRMESNGKASHIHLSETAYGLLQQHFGGQYRTESRGDVIIKGKGVMETFWVLGRTSENSIRVVQKTPPLPPLPGQVQEDIEDEESEAMYRKFTRQATQQLQDDL